MSRVCSARARLFLFPVSHHFHVCDGARMWMEFERRWNGFCRGHMNASRLSVSSASSPSASSATAAAASASASASLAPASNMVASPVSAPSAAALRLLTHLLILHHLHDLVWNAEIFDLRQARQRPTALLVDDILTGRPLPPTHVVAAHVAFR